MNKKIKNQQTKSSSLETYTPRYNLWFSLLFGCALVIIGLGLEKSPLLRLQVERNEYVFIADSIVYGFGFSNPFGNCTPEEHEELCPTSANNTFNGEDIVITPTAWMPPFLPFLLATLFKIFGHRSIEALFVLFGVKLLLFSLSAFALQKIFFQNRPALFDRFALTLVLVFILYLHRTAILGAVHDTFIIAPLSIFGVYFLVKGFTRRFGKRDPLILTLLAGVTTLSTATLGYAFFLLAGVGAFFATPENRKGFRCVLLASLVALALWATRNTIVMGKPMLNKSNLWYDFYQAQVLDDDGIVSYSTFQLYHPIVNLDSHLDYLKKGEVDFMAQYQEKSYEYLKNNFSDYLLRCTRRLLNTLIIVPTLDTFAVSGDFAPEVLEKLIEEKVVTFHPYAKTHRWVNIHYPIAEREEIFAKHFSPEIQSALLKSLKYSKASYFYHRNKSVAVWRRRLMGTLPTLCIVIGLFWARIRRNPIFLITLALYICYLGPYVLVSHYQRYQLGLMGIHTMLFMLVYLALRERFRFRTLREKNTIGET